MDPYDVRRLTKWRKGKIRREGKARTTAPMRIVEFGRRVLVVSAKVVGGKCRLEVREGDAQHYPLVVPLETNSVCDLLDRVEIQALNPLEPRALRVVLGRAKRIPEAVHDDDRVLALVRRALRKHDPDLLDDDDDCSDVEYAQANKHRRFVLRKRWRVIFRRLIAAHASLKRFLRPWIRKHLLHRVIVAGEPAEQTTIPQEEEEEDVVLPLQEEGAIDDTPEEQPTRNVRRRRPEVPDTKLTRILLLPVAARSIEDLMVIDKVLARSPFGAGIRACSKVEARTLLSRVTLRVVPENQVIARPGETHDAYLVLSGTVDVGEQTLGPGTAIGDLGVLACSRKTQVVRSRGVVLLRIPRSVVVGIARKRVERELMILGDALGKLRIETDLLSTSKRVHAAATKRTFRVNQILAQQGHPARDIFIITKGECKLIRTVREMHLECSPRLYPGDLVGPSCDGTGLSSFSIVAATFVEALIVSNLDSGLLSTITNHHAQRFAPLTTSDANLLAQVHAASRWETIRRDILHDLRQRPGPPRCPLLPRPSSAIPGKPSKHHHHHHRRLSRPHTAQRSAPPHGGPERN